MKDLVKQMMAGLGDLSAKLDETESVEDRLSRGKAELEMTQKALKEAKDELGKATAGLSEAQVANAKRHDEEIFKKQGELRDLVEMHKGLKEEYDSLVAKMKEDKAYYDTLCAGIEAVRQKLR